MRPALILTLIVMAATAAAQPTSFDRLLAELEATPPAGRQAAVDAFWARLAATPLIENDSTAVFLFRGEAASVGLLGDMSLWNGALPLARIDGTDLWYRRDTFEPNARLEYLFMVDGDFAGFGSELLGRPDPMNPHRVLSGFGPFSELAMPGYAYPEVFDAVRDGTPGSFDGLDLHHLPAGVLPYPHEVLVHTPTGASGALPSVYFVDGRDYVEFAHVPRVIDWLVERGEIAPVRAVFVDPPNRHGAEAPNRTTEYGMNDDFVAFLADELVPFIDEHYPASGERLIVGDSYGGLIAAYVAFSRPEVFGMAYSQSGYHSFQRDRMIDLIRGSEPAPVRLFVDIGTYETRVGAGFLPEEEGDFLAANRRLRDALASRGYDVVYAEYPQGHTWGNWRAHLIDALRHFFPPSSE